MRPKISMREALQDLFANIMGGESWYGWRVLLIAAAGEQLNDDERREYKRLTGREREPGKMCRELIAIFGRRAGKSVAMTVFMIWLAALCDHPELIPGETGVALLISRDQRVARIILNYGYDFMLRSEPLRSMIYNKTADAIELTNHTSIEVRPCSYRILRGPTFICVVCDEVAQWYTAADFANPDSEVLTAVRPGLLTTRGPILMVSSAYAKTGVLYDSYKKYFGPDGPDDIIVAFGTSRDMNPSLPQEEIDRALERDPVANRAEFLSEWRSDVEGFIPREVVEACVGDYIELPPYPNINYGCFFDPASGVPDGDSLAFVIAHKDGDRAVIDVIREIKPPFNFFDVIQTELLPLCRAYRIYKIVGDNYGGELAKDPVRRAGISYELAQKHTSELYVAPLLPMLNAKKVLLPRHERAISQICSLERSALRSGREQITHPIHGHDDIATSIAGAVDLVYSHSSYTLDPFQPNFRDRDLPPEPEPEPPGPPGAGGDWWRGRSQPPQTSSANQRLLDYYKSIDLAFKFGFR
jgi:hypothetical protein